MEAHKNLFVIFNVANYSPIQHGPVLVITVPKIIRLFIGYARLFVCVSSSSPLDLLKYFIWTFLSSEPSYFALEET